MEEKRTYSPFSAVVKDSNPGSGALRKTETRRDTCLPLCGCFLIKRVHHAPRGVIDMVKDDWGSLREKSANEPPDVTSLLVLETDRQTLKVQDA